jgi:hypothetical protein
MNMSEDLIKLLVAEHQHVRPFSAKPGWAFAAVGVCVAAFATHLAFGFRADLLAGAPHDIVVIRGAVLLVLGIAALAATVSMARPGVGNHADGWLWVALVAALFPLYALLSALTGQFPVGVIYASSGIRCLWASGAIGIVIASGLVIWLRTAAPVRPKRLGWSVGIASGSLATLAYSFACPSNSIAYAGLWYTLAVLGTAVLCRLAVPRLLHW